MALWRFRFATSLEKLPPSLTAQAMLGSMKHGALAEMARPFVVDLGDDPLAVDIRRKYEVELQHHREAARTVIELFLGWTAL